MFWLVILISGLLYRIPRGGGLGEGRSFEGAAIWAGATGIGFGLVFWSFWPLAIIPLLMLGETQAKSNYWPSSPGASVWKHSLQGCLLLNPLMGPIYYGWYHLDQRFGLPTFSRYIDGYTAWAELNCGPVTALSYGVLLCFLLT